MPGSLSAGSLLSAVPVSASHDVKLPKPTTSLANCLAVDQAAKQASYLADEYGMLVRNVASSTGTMELAVVHSTEEFVRQKASAHAVSPGGVLFYASPGSSWAYSQKSKAPMRLTGAAPLSAKHAACCELSDEAVLAAVAGDHGVTVQVASNRTSGPVQEAPKGDSKVMAFTEEWPCVAVALGGSQWIAAATSDGRIITSSIEQCSSQTDIRFGAITKFPSSASQASVDRVTDMQLVAVNLATDGNDDCSGWRLAVAWWSGVLDMYALSGENWKLSWRHNPKAKVQNTTVPQATFHAPGSYISFLSGKTLIAISQGVGVVSFLHVAKGAVVGSRWALHDARGTGHPHIKGLGVLDDALVAYVRHRSPLVAILAPDENQIAHALDVFERMEQARKEEATTKSHGVVADNIHCSVSVAKPPRSWLKVTPYYGKKPGETPAMMKLPYDANRIVLNQCVRRGDVSTHQGKGVLFATRIVCDGELVGVVLRTSVLFRPIGAPDSADWSRLVAPYQIQTCAFAREDGNDGPVTRILAFSDDERYIVWSNVDPGDKVCGTLMGGAMASFGAKDGSGLFVVISVNTPVDEDDSEAALGIVVMRPPYSEESILRPTYLSLQSAEEHDRLTVEIGGFWVCGSFLVVLLAFGAGPYTVVLLEISSQCVNILDWWEKLDTDRDRMKFADVVKRLQLPDSVVDENTLARKVQATAL